MTPSRDSATPKKGTRDNGSTNGDGATLDDAILAQPEKPVFLKLAFGRAAKKEIPNPLLEDDDVYYARPWQERNHSIAFMVVFRQQFGEFFDRVPEFGPQDVEEAVEASHPSDAVMDFMCRMLTLVSDRTRPVENPNYNRAIATWSQGLSVGRQDPRWEGVNPLAGDVRFPDLNWQDRLSVLELLVDSCLLDCKVIREKIEYAYRLRISIEKGKAENILDVPAIGLDDAKNQYYLVKGRNTRFRLYVQTDPAHEAPQRWFSVASTVPELIAFIDSLSQRTTTMRGRALLRALREQILPEIEASEQARQEEEYRRQRAAMVRDRRAAVQANLAEAALERSIRTRGRRVDYSDLNNGDDDSNDDREQAGPVFTASGRRVKRTRLYTEADDDEDEEEENVAHNDYDNDAYEVPIDDDDDSDDDELALTLTFKLNPDRLRRVLRPANGHVSAADIRQELMSDGPAMPPHMTQAIAAAELPDRVPHSGPKPEPIASPPRPQDATMNDAVEPESETLSVDAVVPADTSASQPTAPTRAPASISPASSASVALGISSAVALSEPTRQPMTEHTRSETTTVLLNTDGMPTHVIKPDVVMQDAPHTQQNAQSIIEDVP